MRMLLGGALILLLTFPLAFAQELTLRREVLDGQSVPHLRFSGPERLQSYLTMNLPYAPMAELHKQLQRLDNRLLHTRGEAHITVVSPVEFFDVLKPALVTIEEVDRIAEAHDIQRARFEVVCLGRSDKKMDHVFESVYYVVVRSEDLLQIRRAVRELYLAKGGNPGKFLADDWEPHITLVYTRRDLFREDGAIKDDTSCAHPLRLL